MVNPIEFL
jgi:hypothetical protein